MNKTEWDKLWSYIIGCFPSWKPNSASETSWLNELIDYEPGQIIAVLRELAKNEKSNFFPPSVFKVKAELKTKRAATNFLNNCPNCRGHAGVVSVRRNVAGSRWPQTATMRCSCAIGSAMNGQIADGEKREWAQWGVSAQQRGWVLND